MILLLVKKSHGYSLLSPTTYGSETWGSNDQEEIIKKKKYWYIQTWTSGNEWCDDERDSFKLNVILETTDIDEIVNYLVKHKKEKYLNDIYTQYKEIVDDYVSFGMWVHKI